MNPEYGAGDYGPFGGKCLPKDTVAFVAWGHRSGWIISNFTLLLSLSYFLVSLIFQLWLPAGVLVLWWLVSRGVRISPNLLKHPLNIRLIPVYVATNFAMAIMRIYALLTLNRQDWLTRGARKRTTSLGLVVARVGTVCIMAYLFWWYITTASEQRYL